MKIHRVNIRNYRGIRELDWKIDADVICLVGPGDSTKTTILDAISSALSSRWYLPVSQSDFYNGDTSTPINIFVTITGIPDYLANEEKFGLYFRGISRTGEINDDPLEEDIRALTIRLIIDESFEPQWSVVKTSNKEGKKLTSKDRERLHVFRVDSQSDHHLGWGRGSALAALTGNIDSMPGLLAEARKKAAESVAAAAGEQLTNGANIANDQAVTFGVATREGFRPGLDPSALAQRTAFVLFDGSVPAMALGLGSRRLTAVALQNAQTPKDSIIIVDEIEHGLEPHRLRHLIRQLKQPVINTNDCDLTAPRQLIASTHSPIAISEFVVADLHIVRNTNGKIEVKRFTDTFAAEGITDPQALARAGAEAILARRIIVGEGKTEVGFCRALAEHWKKKRNKPLSHTGTVEFDGNGEQADTRALGFVKLGYPTALLMDSDKGEPKKANEFRQAGGQLIQWGDQLMLEGRITKDLPIKALQEFLQIAAHFQSEPINESAMLHSILQELPNPLSKNPQSLNLMEWTLEEEEMPSIRTALGAAAHKKKWFKNIERGEALGALVVKYIDQLQDTDLFSKIEILEAFAYAEGQPISAQSPTPTSLPSNTND